MMLDRRLVGMGAEEYRAYFEGIRNAHEIRRCLLALDVDGMRRVWRQMSPHLDQPESDWDALCAMHQARMRMEKISPQQKRYSEHWLRELATKTRIAAAVGISVKPRSSEYKGRARDVQDAMGEAVIQAHKEGVDLEWDGAEVQRRMKAAKLRVYQHKGD